MRTLKIFSIVFFTVNFMLAGSFNTSQNAKLSVNRESVESRSGIRENHYSSMYNGKVKIYSLTRNGSDAGHSLWLYRTGRNVKAKYFAYKQNGKSIYQRYNEWKNGKQVISYCAGPYTAQNYNVPQGLTIDNGELVNRNIDKELDGLVIVEAVGGVRVADLEKPSSQCINLVSIKQSLNPRNSSSEKNRFINWAKNENATVFQTNLMYFRNERKFGNVSETANRRIFVLAYHGNEVVHIIFNITQSVSLTEISEEIYDYLKGRNVRVIGILNFDTGMYDIFQAFKQNRLKDSNLKGSTPVSDAQNLMVYYYEK